MKRRMHTRSGGFIPGGAGGVVGAALAVWALVAGGAPAGAKSTTPLANLKITADTVTIRHKGQTDFVAAKDGEGLRQGDTIKTDENGTAEIDYTDGSLTR